MKEILATQRHLNDLRERSYDLSVAFDEMNSKEQNDLQVVEAFEIECEMGEIEDEIQQLEGQLENE